MCKSLKRVGMRNARVGKVLAKYGMDIRSYFQGERFSEFFRWKRDGEVPVPYTVWCWNRRNALRKKQLRDAEAAVKMAQTSYNRSCSGSPPLPWSLRRTLRADFKAATEARRKAQREMDRFLAKGPCLSSAVFIRELGTAIREYYTAIEKFQVAKDDVVAMSQQDDDDDDSIGPDAVSPSSPTDDTVVASNSTEAYDDDDEVPQTPGGQSPAY